MSFSIPTLPQSYARVMGAFRAYADLDASLPANNVRPLAKVIAGRDHEILGHLDYVIKQIFVRTSDEESLGRHGDQYGVPRTPATLASGHVDVTSGGDLVVPAGTLLTRADGVQYETTAAGSLAAAGVLTLPVEALAAGAAANADAATPLTLGSGVTGLGAPSATAAVSSDGVFGGLEVEEIEDWRSRILFRLRDPPHGGAPSDYVMWARVVPGVTRVYVERRYLGPGTVRVFPLFDDLFAAAGGIATPAYVDAVMAVIESVAPATAFVAVSAPTAQPINITATGVAPYTGAVLEAIRAELRDMMRRLGAVSGSDTPRASMPFLATPQTFSRSWIWQAIANATGEERHALVSPAADVVIGAGCVPTLGTVSLSA